MDKGEVSYNAKAYVYGFTCTLTGLIFGFSISIMNNFFVHYMQGRYPSRSVTQYNKIESLMNTFFNLGALVCCITSAVFMRFPRKWLNIIFGIVNIILILVQIPAPLEMVYALRFLLGYIACYYSLLGPMMIQEALPNKYVGRLGSFFYLFIASGVQISFTFTFDWVEKYYYIVIAIPAIIEIIRLFVYIVFFNIETPLYVFNSLKAQIKAEKAAEALKRSENEKELISNEDIEDSKSEFLQRFCRDQRIKKFLNCFYKEELHEEVQVNLFNEYSAVSGESKKKMGICEIITSKKYRKQFFLVAVINFANQLTGINIIIFYSTNVFKQLGFGNPEFLTFLVSNFVYFE